MVSKITYGNVGYALMPIIFKNQEDQLHNHFSGSLKRSHVRDTCTLYIENLHIKI